PVEVRVPRRPDGTVDTQAAIAAGLVRDFYPTAWEGEERTVTLIGHWEGSTIVVEDVVDGEVEDDRPETGYWAEGLWAAAGTGLSVEDIAASMLVEYEQAR